MQGIHGKGKAEKFKDSVFLMGHLSDPPNCKCGWLSDPSSCQCDH